MSDGATSYSVTLTPAWRLTGCTPRKSFSRCSHSAWSQESQATSNAMRSGKYYKKG